MGQALANNRRTTIGTDGLWSTDVWTGGIDHLATEYRAFLLPGDFDPPDANGQSSLPDSLAEQAIAVADVTRGRPPARRPRGAMTQ